MTPGDPNQALVEAQHRSLLIIWVVLFTSVLGFFVMTLILRPNAKENFVLTVVLIVFSLSTTSWSFRFKGMLLKQSVERQDLEYVLRAYIVALALCETSAIFGVLIYFVTGSVYYYVAMGTGIIGMVLHFPKKQHLLDASFKKL